MTISVKTFSSGEIRCETEIDGRPYKKSFLGCGVKEARKRFRAKVVAAESKLMDEKRQEIIDACLNCTIPVEQCKGNCKIKQTIKIKRGKGIL